MEAPVGVKRRRFGGVTPRRLSAVIRHGLTPARLGLGVGIPVVLLLGLSQAVLPRLAVQRVRDRIKPYGELQHVSVSAFPALELLWGKADAVNATAGTLALSSAQALKLTWESNGVGEVNLHVNTLRLKIPGVSEAVVLREVVTHKRGNRLSGQAIVTHHDLTQASPSGVRIQPLPSEAGTLRVRASGSLFGAQASVEALVVPREGKLIAQPLNIPFGSFVELTLFSDPHVYVDGISATPLGGGGEASWRVVMRGHLR